MKVLITGGSGLIGQALTEKLLAGGHSVIILSRSPEKVGGQPAGVEVAKWDARTAQGWGHLVNEVDGIVNLAGASLFGDFLLPSRWTKKRKALVYNSRKHAGEAVVEAVSQASRKPEVVVQSSGIGYYGFHADEKLTESDPPADDFLGSLSVDWEASTKPVEAMGVRRVIIRTGLVLSNQGGVLPLFKLQFSLFVGGWMGSGGQYYSWIHLDDEANAILHLLENKESSGAYNLTAPQPVTNKEFSKALGAVMRRPVWFPLPEFVLKLVLGQVAELSTRGQRVFPARLQEGGFEYKFPEIKPALRDLVGK